MARGVAHTTREITLPRPYDADRLFAFLAGRAIPTVETVEHLRDGWRYRRSIRLPAGAALGEITATDGAARITVQSLNDRDTSDALDALERVLDLASAPSLVDDALRGHPESRDLIEQRPGLRVPRAADRPEVAFRALIGQQVSVAAASTTCGFIAAEYGDRLPPTLCTSEINRLWPSPAVLASLDPATLRMPRAKATAVTTLAAALRDGEVDLTLPGADVRTQLLTLKGIGPWTAGYISMRACADDDVLLDSDLIARRGAGLIGLPSEPRALRAAGERFAPWRSYLTMHLWSAYAAP